jgi:hypothetical protein
VIQGTDESRHSGVVAGEEKWKWLWWMKKGKKERKKGYLEPQAQYVFLFDTLVMYHSSSGLPQLRVIAAANHFIIKQLHLSQPLSLYLSTDPACADDTSKPFPKSIKPQT